MAKSLDRQLVVTLAAALLMLVCVEAVNARFHNRDLNNAASACPSGKYYDLNMKECRKCSFCPVNEIVRRPCHKHRDTVCGPFVEFERFNQAPSEEKQGSKDHVETDSKNVITNKVNKAEGLQPDEETKQQQSHDVYETVGKEKTKPEPSAHEPGLASVTTDANEQWRLLALVLIGVLFVVSVLLVVFVFIACYMLKRKRLMEKTVICSSDAQPTGHYFRPPVFTGGRLNPTDHMRALLHVDSESGNSPQRKKDLFRVYNDNASSCLSNVPVYSDQVVEPTEDAADCLVASAAQPLGGDQSSGFSSSGFPEVVPGPSTDYVYFKAPVKHTFGQV